MKTSRDWLLASHEAAVPDLDRLRQAALPPTETTWGVVLRDLFFPHRAAWGAIGIVWLGLLALHLTLARNPQRALLHTPSQDAVSAFVAQNRFNEIVAQINRSR